MKAILILFYILSVYVSITKTRVDLSNFSNTEHTLTYNITIETNISNVQSIHIAKTIYINTIPIARLTIFIVLIIILSVCTIIII